MALRNGYRLGLAMSGCLCGASAAAAVALFRNEERGKKIDLAGLATGATRLNLGNDHRQADHSRALPRNCKKFGRLDCPEELAIRTGPG
jgi:hypothetical protein